MALVLVYGHPGKDEEAIEIAFHMFNSFVSTINLMYRPEYYGAHHICVAVAELLLSSQLGAAPLIIIFLGVIVCYRDFFHRMVFGRKATKESTRFREAWLECSERNPDVVTELARLSKGIVVRLDQQREEALQMLPWYRKVQAYLEQRVGRWSLIGKGKARQKSTDLDLLMLNAGTINEKFQDLVSAIGSQNQNTRLEFVLGPVKQPMRTLQKVVRRYRRDVGCLTDLVRCTVVAESLGNVEDFLQLLYPKSVVGLDSSFEEEGKGSRQRLREQPDTGDQIFRITALENRFDPSYDAEKSMGYRHLVLNVEVGWLISDGLVAFQKVCDWRRLNCHTHICEIQVRTRAIHEWAVERHQEYLILREGLSK
jgi:ppGpp synthetase/RelA/SpoT-type nucleotidyltranferase